MNRRTVLVLGVATAGALAVGPSAPVGAQDAPAVPGRILFVRNGSIWQWSAGDATRIYKANDTSHARWSPDAKQVLFVQSGNSYSDLVVLNIQGGSKIPLTQNRPDYEEGTPEYAAAASWVSDPDWTSTGIIGFMSDMQSADDTMQLWLMASAGASPSLAPAAQFEDNIDGLSLASDGSVAAYVVQQRQPDGTSTGGGRLRDLSDGVAYPLADGKNVADPAISPDLQTIALSIRSDAGMSDIFLTGRTSSSLKRVTRNANASNPVWSPDGKWLAFIRMVDFDFEVWACSITDGAPGRPVKVFRAKGLAARSGLSWTFATG